jgi:ribosome maturation factor RimP
VPEPPWEAEGVYSEHFDKGIRDAVEPLLTGMGYSLVEIATGRRKGTTRVSVVIYRKKGVGIEDCAEVSRLLLPRLETMEELPEVSLEVSSPGIERFLKSPAEYAIFVGRGVRILHGEETEWRTGIIDRVEGETVWLRTGKGKNGFALGGIRKARLDHAVEVEEDKNAV